MKSPQYRLSKSYGRLIDSIKNNKTNSRNSVAHSKVNVFKQIKAAPMGFYVEKIQIVIILESVNMAKNKSQTTVDRIVMMYD